MDKRLWARIVFIYLAFQAATIGFWALPAPRSFYDGFPGLGRAWIAIDGPYNEHLVRDFGALNLALLVLLLAAACSLSREMVTIAAVASIVWGLPHVIYHLFNTEGLSTGDVVISVGGLAVLVILPVSVLLAPPSSAAAPPA